MGCIAYGSGSRSRRPACAPASARSTSPRGTGDLGAGLARQVGRDGLAVLTDINREMLSRGRDRLIDRGLAAQAAFRDRERRMPAVSRPQFRLRDDRIRARQRHRQARGASLHAARPAPRWATPRAGVFEADSAALQPAYDAYSFNVLPRLGGIVAGDAASYRYLAESIRMHPDQQTLAAMFHDAGFDECRWHNLAGGIVALHIGCVF